MALQRSTPRVEMHTMVTPEAMGGVLVHGWGACTKTGAHGFVCLLVAALNTRSARAQAMVPKHAIPPGKEPPCSSSDDSHATVSIYW
jgi:hypothetical protein